MMNSRPLLRPTVGCRSTLREVLEDSMRYYCTFASIDS